jgi:hypothetical protein
MWRHYNVILSNGDNTTCVLDKSQRLRDMKYIGFKHQRENKQISDNNIYSTIL